MILRAKVMILLLEVKVCQMVTIWCKFDPWQKCSNENYQRQKCWRERRCILTSRNLHLTGVGLYCRWIICLYVFLSIFWPSIEGDYRKYRLFHLWRRLIRVRLEMASQVDKPVKQDVTESDGKQYNFRQKMFDTFNGNCSTSIQRNCSTTKTSTENVRHLL